jgi:integrative and conjugative element protein (TIGR02256 family)
MTIRKAQLYIGTDLADVIRSASNDHAPNETGGVLLGFHLADGHGSCVTHLVGAGPNATRSRSRFKPDGKWQESEVARLYEASDRSLSYLGDWHSHPSGGKPSSIDRSTAQNIASTRGARCPMPVILIVTGRGDSWDLRGYRTRWRRMRQIHVTECEALVTNAPAN